jgi:hypothetical protein
MGPILEEFSALKIIVTHLLSRISDTDRRDLSEAIHSDLQEAGEGGIPMATYRAKVDEIIARAASLSRS